MPLTRFLSCLAFASALLSLQSTTQTSPAPGAPVAQAGTADTLRITSRIVYVDVVVRDGHGNIVHDLPQSAFSIQENKQAQRIGLFEEHTAAMEERAAQVKQQKGVRDYANVAPEAQDTSLNMVLLDLINTAPQDQNYARQRMVAFLKQLPPHKQVALFVLGNQLRMVQGFTTDASTLVKAAGEINPKQFNRLRTPNQQVWDNDYAVYLDRDAGGPGSQLGQSLLETSLLEDVNNMKSRLDVTNRAFQELARAVNGYAGRKNLYWLAGQFPSSTYYELQTLSSTAPPMRVTPGGLRQDAARQQREFAGAAAAAGLSMSVFSDRANRAISDSQIAVYPISVVGIQTDNVGPEMMGIGSAGTTRASTTANLYFNERQTGRAVMEHIADETGGEAFYGNNDPKGLLDRGFEDGNNFYTLAYQPTDRDWNGKYRTIHVAVNGSGYKLSYRKGYFALPQQPTGNALQQFAQAMRIESPASTMLVLRSGEPVKQASGETIVPATLDVHGVGFNLDEKTGLREAKLQVMVIAYPAEHGAQPVQANHMLNLRLEPEDYAKVLESGVPLPIPLKLAPGSYAVRVGVVDAGSGRIGTLTLPYSSQAAASARR